MTSAYVLHSRSGENLFADWLIEPLTVASVIGLVLSAALNGSARLQAVAASPLVLIFFVERSCTDTDRNYGERNESLSVGPKLIIGRSKASR